MTILHQLIETFASKAEQYFNGYAVVLLLALFLQLLFYLTERIQKPQFEKRKLILKDIDEMKQLYRNPDFQAKEKTFLTDMLELIRFQTLFDDEQKKSIKTKSSEIVKKHKGNPWLIVIPFIVQVVFFVTIVSCVREMHSIDHPNLLPIVATILTFFSAVTRKMIVFYVITAGLSFWIYTHLNGALLVLFVYLAAFKLIKRMIISIKTKKEEGK